MSRRKKNIIPFNEIAIGMTVFDNNCYEPAGTIVDFGSYNYLRQQGYDMPTPDDWSGYDIENKSEWWEAARDLIATDFVYVYDEGVSDYIIFAYDGDPSSVVCLK